ncbi:hypothetical protein BGX28_007117 [Mortierella sp. GBA30]|nr:hypothetical protein BGX28_007117 [Mortierella sp. GBA30]
MSLYGDLPPPSSSSSAESPAKNSDDAKNVPANTTKSSLPAGWSSSITRFKPLLNRKLAPPKPKPAQRAIPPGFVAHSVSEVRQEAKSITAAPGVASATALGSSAAILPVAAQHSHETTVDESSWLKARTAQVQRQDNDIHARKQVKRTPVKVQQQQGPVSLDDDYDISRPNEYTEFKALFEEEWVLRMEEKKRQQDQERSTYGSRYSRTPSHSRSRSRSWSRSRSRSHSPHQPVSRSRSRSRRRSRSRTSSRSGSRHRSRSRRSHSRDQSRSPLLRGHGSNRSHQHASADTTYTPPRTKRPGGRSRSRSSSRSRGRGRSRSPHSKRVASSRSRSPLPSFSRRRSPSPVRRHGAHRPSSPSRNEQNVNPGRSLAYKAFAPPPSQTTYSHSPALALERKVESSISPVQDRGPAIISDASGEEAFLRRAQLTQQRLGGTSGASPASNPSEVSFPQQAQQQYRAASVTKALETSRKGAPSSVILLTNMVGPGEVDDTLQEETAVECERFGPVVRCLIFEVQNGKVPPEEAVRIFVKFGSLASAERALNDLDGRFFGGRQVRGQFFDEKRFDSLQLAP